MTDDINVLLSTPPLAVPAMDPTADNTPNGDGAVETAEAPEAKSSKL